MNPQKGCSPLVPLWVNDPISGIVRDFLVLTPTQNRGVEATIGHATSTSTHLYTTLYTRRGGPALGPGPATPLLNT